MSAKHLLRVEVEASRDEEGDLLKALHPIGSSKADTGTLTNIAFGATCTALQEEDEEESDDGGSGDKE